MIRFFAYTHGLGVVYGGPVFSLLLWACAEAPVPAPNVPPEADEPEVIARPTVPAEPKGPPNRPPRIDKLSASPKAPRVGETVRLTVSSTDPEGQVVRCSYVWKVDGAEDVLSHTDSFSRGDLKRGEVISATVVCRDDALESESASIEVTVQGDPPVMLTTLDELRRVDRVKMRAEDPDGGPITWSLSGGVPGLTLDSDGTLHLDVPKDAKPGAYKAVIQATDNDGEFVKAEVPITINPPPESSKTAPQ